MRLEIVSTAARPALVPVVTDWLWNAFWRAGGSTREDVLHMVAASVAAVSLPRCFVLLADDVPVGTASLVAHDLDERPDLTPWLAGVFVIPAARGRGHAGRLIAAVESEARARSVAMLWLYTDTAESVYARAGWCVAETITDHRSKTVPGRVKPVTLMRRDLTPARQS